MDPESSSPSLNPVPSSIINVDETNAEEKNNEAVNGAAMTNSDGVEESLYEKKKRKKTSKVWDEFKEISLPSGKNMLQCIHCKHKMPFNDKGTTSQFLRHLKSCIQRRLNMKGQRQLNATTITDSAQSVNAVQNFKYEYAKIREIASHMILVHELPFAFIEYELFNLLMRTATPNYEKISRTTIKKDCMTSYEMEKKRLKALLKDVDRVSITTDLWKSGQNVQYMVLTCHFVDSNWTLQKCILNFCNVPPLHTGLAICDALYKCLVEWGIEKKVWSITVDNASYNDSAMRNLKGNLSFQKKLPINRELFYVRCCVHILNILVQEGLSEIHKIIENVRQSVKHISISESRLVIFSEIVKQLNLPAKKLILDCCTRWNATYIMLFTALDFKDVFPRYQQRDPSYHSLPNDEDWEQVSKVCSFLEIFNEITLIVSGSEYPTSNLFLPELWRIKEVLDEKFVFEDVFMQAMAKKIKAKFDKYWSDSNLLISIAAILDPKNKMKLIEFCFPLVYQKHEATKHINTVLEKLHMLFNEYVTAHTMNNTEQPLQEDAQKDGFVSKSTEKGKSTTIGRSKFDIFIRTVDTIQQVKLELDVYLEEGVLYMC